MQVKEILIDVRALHTSEDKNGGLVLVDTVLLTSRTDSFNTVILPNGCIGPEESTVVDTDHLFQPTRAYIKNRRVVSNGDETELICDIVIPKNALRYWVDGKGNLKSENMVEAIKRGDMTGLSVNFDYKAYREHVFTNEFGRIFYSRYTLPFISILFGKPQGQQFARLGKTVELNETQFSAYSRALQLYNKNNMLNSKDNTLRCLCNEFIDPKRIYSDANKNIWYVMVATETEATIINSSNGESMKVISTDPLWDELKAVDQSTLEILEEESIPTDEETRSDETEKVEPSKEVEIKETIETPEGTKEADKPAEISNDQEINESIEDELRGCGVCDATRKIIMEKMKAKLSKSTPAKYNFVTEKKRVGFTPVDLPVANQAVTTDTAITPDAPEMIDTQIDQTILNKIVNDLRTRNDDMRMLTQLMTNMAESVTALIESNKTVPITTEEVDQAVQRAFETKNQPKEDKNIIPMKPRNYAPINNLNSKK